MTAAYPAPLSLFWQNVFARMLAGTGVAGFAAAVLLGKNHGSSTLLTDQVHAVIVYWSYVTVIFKSWRAYILRWQFEYGLGVRRFCFARKYKFKPTAVSDVP